MEAPLVRLLNDEEEGTCITTLTSGTASPSSSSSSSPSLGGHRLSLPEEPAAQWRAGEKTESGTNPTRARNCTSPNLGARRGSGRREDDLDQALEKDNSSQRHGRPVDTGVDITMTTTTTSSSGESGSVLEGEQPITEARKGRKMKTKKGERAKTKTKKKKKRASTTEGNGMGPIDELRRGLLELQPQATDEHAKTARRDEEKQNTKTKTKTKSGEGKGGKKTKKGKKKKRSPRKQTQEAEEEEEDDSLPPTVYVDCIVVEARDLQLPVSTGWGLFGGGPTIPSLYCGVQLGSGTQEFKTWSAGEKAPVWNAGLTFVYRRTIDAALAHEDDLPMTIADNAMLILTVRNRAGRLFPQELSLGEAYVVLETLEDDQVHDVWLPLRPPAKVWSLETLLQPPPEPPLGRLHIILQKTLKPQDGLLAYYGMPSRAIPLRVQPGDVVLFSNTELVRHTIKLVQGCEWDHIGLVVPRPDRSGLFLLEAVVDGVHIFRLDHRLDFYRETAKIAIRRLEVHRTPEMLAALSDFAQEIKGKPYCSLYDIIKTYGTGAVPAEGTWFCSQLVAAAFQRMGILAAQPAAWAYLPGDFVADNQPSYTHNPPPDAAPLAPPKLQLLQGRLSDILISPMKGVPDVL